MFTPSFLSTLEADTLLVYILEKAAVLQKTDLKNIKREKKLLGMLKIRGRKSFTLLFNIFVFQKGNMQSLLKKVWLTVLELRKWIIKVCLLIELKEVIKK